MTLLELAERIPPCVCRLVARKKVGIKYLPMSTTDIEKSSGLSRGFISQISRRVTWRGVPIEKVDAFALGCGVDLWHPWRTVFFLNRHKKAHLKNANPVQRKMFSRIISNRNQAGSLH